MVTPFRVSYLYYFPRMCLLELSHLKLLKYFHNNFPYDVKIHLRQDIKKENILFHFIKWEIGIYLWKQM
jgi:hypothetical protein